MDYLNFLKDREVTPEEPNRLSVVDYRSGEIIGFFPDMKASDFFGGMKLAEDFYREWNMLNVEDKIDLLRKAGQELEKRNEYDVLKSRAGGYPIKFVRESRRNFAEYLKHASQLFDRNRRGRGILVLTASVTTPEVYPYMMCDGVVSGCSLHVKGDLKDPFSGYEIAEIAHELGLPVEFITYDTKKKSGRAAILYELCRTFGGKFLLMGRPETAKEIAYHEILENKSEEEKNELLENLPIPSEHMVSFVSHGGAGITDETANPETVAKCMVDSFKYPKSCKVSTLLLVNKNIASDVIDELYQRVKRLKVGDVTDPETDIALISEEYYDAHVEPYIRSTRENEREFILGGEEKINQPTIIKSVFYGTLTLEPHYPVFCVEESEDVIKSLHRINEMARGMPKGKILDLSVFSQKDETFKKVEQAKNRGELKVFTVHENQPTTSSNPLVPHEGIILREELSEPNYVDR